MPSDAVISRALLADSGMAQSRGARSALGTLVGYLLAAIIAYFVLRLIVGTIFSLARVLIVVVIVGGLFALYVKLKVPDE